MALVWYQPQHDSHCRHGDGANASGDLFKQVATVTILMLPLVLGDEVALPFLADGGFKAALQSHLCTFQVTGSSVYRHVK